MSAAVIFKGIDLNAVMSAATSAPLGSQKARYSADVAALLGTNPIVRITVNGVTKYQSTISGSLTGTSAGISIPARFVEPPSVNVADALSEAVLEIQHATNTSVKVSMPLKAAVAAGYLTASAALDGTKVVRTSSLLMVPPSPLDVGGGTSGSGTLPSGAPTININTLIDFMKAADQNPQYGIPPAPGASITTPCNYTGINKICRGLSTYYNNFPDYWDALAPWLWLYLGQGHTATGKRIQYRNCILSVQRKSNGQWVDGIMTNLGGNHGLVWDGTSDYSKTNPDNHATRYFSMVRKESEANGGGASVSLVGDDGIEVWADPDFNAIVNRSLMQDAKAGAGICQIRVINNDGTQYSGTDAPVCARLGYDQYATNRSQLSGTRLGSQGINMMDGGKNRWKTIDCSTGWQSVAFVTLDDCFLENGPFPPIGNDSGHWEFTDAPYTITENELRTGPKPSWVTV